MSYSEAVRKVLGSAESETTYADARLRLGIANVGFIVVASIVAVSLSLTEVVLRFEPTQTGDVLGLATVVVLYVLANSPFDYIGGYYLPQKYEDDPPSFGDFASSWGRGVIVQGMAFVSFGTAIMYVGRATHPAGATSAVFVITLFLFLSRPVASQFVSGFDIEGEGDQRLEEALGRFDELDLDRPETLVYDSDEESFVGGVSGSGTVLVPKHWLGKLSPDELAAAIARRVIAVEQWSYRRGIAIAVLWNVGGFGLVAGYTPGAGFGTVAAFTNVVLGYVVWSFLGLLVLPTPTREGVYSVDRATVEAGVPPKYLESVIRAINETQADEESRPESIESIFHPIPCLDRRLERLTNPEQGSIDAWNCARTRLYLSWAGLDFLSRAVHCNVGKPGVWVYLPGD